MLRRYGKVGVLVLALVILSFEAYLSYRWYDRYYNYEAAPGTAGSVADLGETTWQREGPEDTLLMETTGDASDAASDGSTGETSFRHTATNGNSRGDYTYLHDPLINEDPDAIVLASPAGPYERNTGVWYEPQKRRWAIFNQNLAAVPAGTTFEVVVPPEDERFVHRAGVADIVGNITYTDDPLINGKPGAEVSVTQNWNPGGGNGVYNDHPVSVFYDEDVDRWAIYNEDGARMPEGAAFNIVAPKNAGPAK